MNIAITSMHSINIDGFYAEPVLIEVSIKKGIPRSIVVGLPDQAIKESMERIRIAIENSGFRFPMQNILINLSPAGVKKSGSFFDLPIALGILVCSGQIEKPADLDDYIILGELGLDGKISSVTGLLNALINLDTRHKKIVYPFDNRHEATFIKGNTNYPLKHLDQIRDLFNGQIEHFAAKPLIRQKTGPNETITLYRHQLHAFRAIQIALAGKHHLLLSGPPGCGKTMLAGIARSLQPDLEEKEIVEVLRILSVKGKLAGASEIVIERPFRSPHHTASDVSITGGGINLNMGEITLAHNGILFLDELGEFRSGVIQSLREPMEEHRITISRANGHVTYPAGFLLVAATNHCPCGYFGSDMQKCICTPGRIRNYLAKFNGPFLDRIELDIELSPENSGKNTVPVATDKIRESISSAIAMQMERYGDYNGNLKNYQLLDFHSEADEIINSAARMLSPRKAFIIKKVARTIADLEQSVKVKENHILEALSYHSFQNVMSRVA